jgi:hypothetical protein
MQPKEAGKQIPTNYCTISSVLRRRYFGKGDSPQLMAEMST